jgi:putative transposase
MAFIDEHRDRYGVEPICRVLAVAPSSYYAARSRPPSARDTEDAVLLDVIARVHRANFGVYGVRKVWKALARLGLHAGRDRVWRLMRQVQLAGATRARTTRTTRPGPQDDRPGDLVDRRFNAPCPNRLWVADITYVPVQPGFAYTAFITDVFSRRIVGWRTGTRLTADLALDALEMAVWGRRGEDLGHLVHHSDRGVQYLSVRYTARLAEIEAAASVGSRGDSYDNALAESVNGLYKAELVRRHGETWRTAGEVEAATAAWVHWWNTERLHEACGYVPPAEYEAAYHARLHETVEAA